LLFHSNDNATGGAGPDYITLRAPAIRFQTYDNPAVADPDASGGWNNRLTISPTGAVNSVGTLTQGGNQVLHAGNYTSYSPSLGGSGASGTWGISITGSAASLNLSGHTISNSSWAGGGGYHGYQFNGGNWRFGFSSTSGVVDVYADGNFYATDSSHLVLHDGNAPRARNTNLMYYQGFTLDANTMDSNATGFTYAVNAPTVGPVARFSTGGGYDLWLNAAYGGGGTNLFFRTRNGDAASINPWRAIPSYGVNANLDSLFATLYYDGSDTNYYLDPASSGVSLRIGGAIQSNHTPWTGEMNKIQWHGSSLYFQNMNDGFFIFRNSNGAEPFALNANGAGTASASWRSPIFYDSNDTGYYVDPNGTSRIGGIQISPADSGGTGNAIRFYGNGGDGAGAYDHAAIIDRLWGSADQSELLIFKGNDPDTSTIHDRVRIAATGRIVFHSVNGYTAVDAYISGNTGNINGSGYFNGNDLIVTGNVTAYSDLRLKEDVQVIQNALFKIKQLDGVTYTRNDLDDKTRRYAGVIAQQVELVLPEVVEQDEDGLKNVAYGNMVSLLVEAIKEQDKEVTDLRARVAQLETLIHKLIGN
jgi:hypothetical protein